MIRFLNIIFTSCLFFISLCFSSAAMAENAIGYLNKDERNCKNIEKIQKEIETYKKIPISDVSNKKELETIKENFIKQLQGIINTCNDAKKSFPNAMQNLAIQDNNLENDRILLIFSTTSADERDAIYSENFQNQLNNFSENASSQATRDKASQILNNYNTYNEAVDRERDKLDAAFQQSGGKACGSHFPYGCATGQKCVQEDADNSRIRGGQSSIFITDSSSSYTCKDEIPDDKQNITGKYNYKEVSEGDKNTYYTDTWGVSNKTTVNADGSYSQKTSFAKITFSDIEVDKYGQDVQMYKGDNSACNISNMQKMYQSSCYSCKIILTLITTFMNACGKVYDLTRDAGSKVLVIGSMIWLAIFALKLVSSFTNQEPMSIVNDLFIFMFKVAAAYITINVGIGAIVDLFINPLLVAGADYGLGLLQAANQEIINIALTSHFPYQGTEVISSNTIDRLMALTEGIDKTVSTNLVIGHALTCHSFNAGMITIVDPKTLGLPVTLRIPDIWIWICGAAIWFCGFMLTLGIGYYLLDVCFKIGFCIMALPIVIGLWPFGPTSDKFKNCMSIIIRSSALFAFLALVVSYSLSLVSVALGDLTLFYAKIKAGDAEWIANTFSLFGSNFLLILFAYIYSIHLTSKANEYTGKFFSDGVFGDASPIHGKMTQITDFAKKVATAPVKYAGGVVAHQATKAVGGIAGFAVNKAKGMFHSSKARGSAGESGSGAGQGMQAAGQGMQAAGRGVEAAGQGVEAAGEVAQNVESTVGGASKDDKNKE